MSAYERCLGSLRPLRWVGALIAALVLAGCGGGGGSAGGSLSPLAISTSDSFGSGALAGDTRGVWDELTGAGTGGDSGGADGGGAAGVGEFVEVSVRFPGSSSTLGTMTWKILRSEFGLTGVTGTVSIQRDASLTTAENGGYRIVGYPGDAGNLFVERASGQISGSLGVTLGGTQTFIPFTAIRYADSVQTLTAVAGTYNFAYMLADSGTSNNPETGYGAMKINADGTGRICWATYGQPFSYSDSCADHIVISVAYDNPTTPRVLRITSSDSHNVLAYAVARQWNGNVSLSMDVRLTSGGQNRTGGLYGSRMSTAFTPSDYIGAWNETGVDFENAPSYTSSSRMAVAQVGMNVRFASDDGGLCGIGTQTDGTLGAPGFDATVGIASETSPSTGNAVVIPLGLDFLVAAIQTHIGDAGALTFLRRYSSDPSKAPCTPN